jgi:hypothetical protein
LEEAEIWTGPLPQEFPLLGVPLSLAANVIPASMDL